MLCGFLRRSLVALAVIAAGSAAIADELRIGGTGAALGGMKILGTGFEQQHPDVEVTVLPSLGSGGGIKALISGAIDLAVSARYVTPEEAENGARAILYATTPLALATSDETPFDDLSTGELIRILTGETTSWPNGQHIRLVLRPRSETSTKILCGLSDEMKAAVDRAFARPGMYVAVNDQENATALEELAGSLGFVTMGQIATERRRLRVLSLDGVLPQPGASVEQNRLSRANLMLVSREDGQPLADKFISFVLSRESQKILASLDHGPAR